MKYRISSVFYARMPGNCLPLQSCYSCSQSIDNVIKYDINMQIYMCDKVYCVIQVQVNSKSNQYQQTQKNIHIKSFL